MDTLNKNKVRDLWLLDAAAQHVYFVPRDWCECFVDPEDDEPAAYCYAPTHTFPDSPVETLWVPLARLDAMQEITEAEARKVHPALFAYLHEINEGG